MKPGLVMTLRRRHALARWMVALLLLPVLLGVIPAAPISAEQALARDLALAICTPNGAQDQGRGSGSHDQQCVLCTVGCVTCASAAPGGAGLALIAPPIIRHLSRISPVATIPDWPQWRHGAPPRGPPSSLIV